MSFHHLAHVSLASCYLFTNMIPVGSLVALCHEFNDIFVQLSKVFHLTNHGAPAIFSVLTAQAGWFYGRLYCLPLIISEIYYGLHYEPERAHLQPYISFSILFLSALVVLHSYWFCLFQILNYRVLMKGSTDVADIQNDVTKLKRPEREKEL